MTEMIQQLFDELLKKDRENIETIRAALGDKTAALDTPARRAMFMIGFLNPDLQDGVFINSDQPNETYLSVQVHGGTENDSYYMCLGKCLTRLRPRNK